jgi:hypothetical protein
MTRKEYHLQWRTKNRAYVNAKSNEWAKEHKESKRCSARKWEAKHPSLTNHRNMMSRCYNSNTNRYHLYGGKGIKVYKPWHDFKIYEKEWGYTVDRINNHKGYFPNNVKWSTKAEQKLNQRHNNRFTKGR